MALKPTIIIFDSGVGGLSVWQSIRTLRPDILAHYVMDNAGRPYGELPEEVLIHRASDFIQQVVNETAPALVVVACNSASTLVLPKLREILSIPVVGVVPAIKPAAAKSLNKHIGILATPGTVARAYTQTLIDEFAAECKISRIGSSELVEIAEQKMAGEAVPMNRMTAILNPWLADDAPDTIVLGCTHFPLLREEILRLLPNINCIDSGAAIARRVDSILLGCQAQQLPLADPLKPTVWLTRADEVTHKQWPAFQAAGFVEQQILKSRLM